ncbi:hypothetical protein PN462_13190 [Spirulina sp. CS-785/01]|uniref:hypothetical protein n=1 Tax=Spirulina sp. CS-785/01 TaxID=3021716 RepID=UPI00232B2560|nr:hypothetical protein [Spirulina sp. CS-785/01]MDB9314059.1 hypothetical protein [Spirulina sp. CS-785/01]
MTASPRSFSSTPRRRPRKSTAGIKSLNGKTAKPQSPRSRSKVARHPAFNGDTKPQPSATPPQNGNSQETQKNTKVVSHPAFQKKGQSTPKTAANKASSTPSQLPNKQQQFPLWLRTLLAVKNGTSILTGCVVTAVLIVYSSTVYVQQQWTEEYQRLEQLQREHRNLTAADEVFKNQLASQANQENAGLVAPSPSNTIFLPRSEEKPFVEDAQTASRRINRNVNAPLGY